MTKQRVMVVRLFSGHHLSRTGRSTVDGTPALQFKTEDAWRFMAALRPKRWDRNDFLWGASLELLEKRKTHSPVTDQEFAAFLATWQAARLVAEADRMDREAEGYLAQARHAEKMAATMREKAAALRASIAKDVS